MFLILADIVIVSPAIGVGFEKAISCDEMERFGVIFASARRARAVEYGSSFHAPFDSWVDVR